MRYLSGSLLAFVASISMATSAAMAAPVVVPGTTYAFYLQGSESDNPFAGIAIFDDVAETAPRGGLLLSISESETDLGDGKSLISIRLRATGDLFPVAGETALYHLGTFGDGLDLSRAVSLYDARVSFFDANNRLLDGSDNLAADVEENFPWDGIFPTAEYLFGTESIGGRGVTGIDFDFYVSEGIADIPEPASMLLSGLGLMAMIAARRRRQK